MDTPIQIDPESNVVAELALNKNESTTSDSNKTSDLTETKQTNSNTGSNLQTESTQVFNDSLNMDVATKPNKKGYPTDEESIFMKDSSNEENNSQTELNVSSAAPQTATVGQPAKRNFAVKNTSANVLKQNNTNNNVKVNFRKKQQQYKPNKKNEEETTVGYVYLFSKLSFKLFKVYDCFM